MSTRRYPASVLTALAGALAIYVALQLWLTRGTTLFIDEVTMFQQNGGLHPSALLAPFNEHLELARRLMYAICLPLFGAGGSFLAARLIEVASVGALVCVVFVFVSQRIGAAAALAPAILLLFFGSAWELNFAISGIGNVVALAAGAGALLALQRRSGQRDVIACVLLTLSIASFTTGLAFVVGAALLLWLEPCGRRRLWVAVFPLALYAAWLAWVRLVYVPANGEAQHLTLSNVLLIPNMIVQQAASTAGALTGTNFNFEPSDSFAVFSTSSQYGAPFAALAAGALIWRLRRGTRPMIWALVATLLVYWSELAIGSGLGRTPTTIRYVYAAGVITVLLAAAAAGHLLRGRKTLLILYSLVALALLGNLARLRDGMHFYRAFGTAMRAQLAAVEIASPSEPNQFQTHIGAPLFVPLTVGPYLAAVRRYGSPAFSQSQLLAQPETLRENADSVLLAALQIHVAEVSAGAQLLHCNRPAGSSSLAVVVPPGGVGLRAAGTAQLSLSRYAAAPTPLGALHAGRQVDVRIPRDRSGRPWRLTVTPVPARLAVCPLP
ncbi:MAG: hypothetical protein ACR2JH_11585 [Solirubrobacteraceae bacterium]